MESFAGSGRRSGQIIWHYNPIKALWLVWDFHRKKVTRRRDTQIIFIQFAYYSALLPIYHDGVTDRFMLHESFGGLFCWRLMLGFILTSTLVMVAAQMNAFIFHPFVISKFTDVVPLLFTCFLVGVCILHFHTAVKRGEIVQLLNSYNQHVQHVQRTNRQEISSNSDVVSAPMKQAILNMFSMSVIASCMYLFRCDGHFLASALPICRKEVSATGEIKVHYRSFPEFWFYLFLQVITATQQNCAMFPYIAIGFTVVYDGLDMIRELATRPSRLGERQRTEKWVVEYRAFELLSNQVNICLGAHFLPIHLLEIMGLGVLTTFILVRLQLHPYFVLSLLTLDVLILYFLSIWKKGSAFIDLSAAAVQNQKMTSRGSPYDKRVFRSCKPISIRLGGYIKLRQNLILAAFATILDSTVSLLLLY